MKALIVSNCSNKLHELEFVAPLVRIANQKMGVVVVNHKKTSRIRFKEYSHIIISGTGLQDFEYMNSDFKWLTRIDKPLLGVGAGILVIGNAFGCQLMAYREIGMRSLVFSDEFLGLRGRHEVYLLHNLGIKNTPELREQFKLYASTRTVQAIKHKTKQLYAVMFQPEVRNEKLIESFLRL